MIAVISTGHTLRRESTLPARTIRSPGTRLCGTVVLIVDICRYCDISRNQATSSLGVIYSIAPLSSTQTIPKAVSVPTSRFDIENAESTTNGILYVSFEVITVSVSALNGDCEILIYLWPFVSPSIVTISPVPLSNYINNIRNGWSCSDSWNIVFGDWSSTSSFSVCSSDCYCFICDSVFCEHWRYHVVIERSVLWVCVCLRHREKLRESDNNASNIDISCVIKSIYASERHT